ncbi:MAG TPA: DUF3253 domain-containing protein [Limnobacter sp.]|nr:DUF3253 domain-containing protein [Limnobacter sp.]
MPAVTPLDHLAIESLIFELLGQRAPGRSVCPSEVARQFSPEGWRNWMSPVRGVARELLRQGRLRVTQGDRTLNAHEDWHGPVRLRLPACGKD